MDPDLLEPAHWLDAQISQAIRERDVQIERHSVRRGTKLKAVVHFVGGPQHDTEAEWEVTCPWIESARNAAPDTNKRFAPAFEYGRYRLESVVTEGDTPVFAAVWEGWR